MCITVTLSATWHDALIMRYQSRSIFVFCFLFHKTLHSKLYYSKATKCVFTEVRDQSGERFHTIQSVIKMKPFRTIRKNLALIGIMPKQFHYRWYPFSRQCLIVNLINLIGLISTTMFTIRANSIQEYMDSFYVQMMGNNILISYTTVVLNMKKWFCFCENCEKLLGK